MTTKITAKDFFLHLGAIITFYASTAALISLLFEVINFAYPKVTDAYQYYFPSISFQVATLIVAFPIFLVLSRILQKSYENDPELRQASVKRGLSFLTLFVAGGVVAGDLVTVIYMFLDGQELTTGFLLKVLALLVIVGGIFLYYLRDIKNVISAGERNIWRVIALVIILGSIITGFMVVGSPRAQRERRYDSQRVSDLQSIQWQLVNQWQQKRAIPESLSALEDSISGYMVPTDPKTKAAYEYTRTGNLTFTLCATFDRVSQVAGSSIAPTYYPEYPTLKTLAPDNWSHEAGRTCFDRTIDPELYPVVPR